MQLMFFLACSAYACNPTLGMMLIQRLVRLSIQTGVSGVSVVGFASLSYLLCGSGFFEDGNRYSRLTYQFCAKYPELLQSWEPRCQLIVHGFNYCWFHPFRETF
jgi:hypothetical protein